MKERGGVVGKVSKWGSKWKRIFVEGKRISEIPGKGF